jgi:hypothetical protein
VAIWTVASVDAEPKLALCQWRILEATYADPDEPATRHFIGCTVERLSGRVSSAIQVIDLETLRGVTDSGRVYELKGVPGQNLEAEYLWTVWGRVYGVSSWTDVTRLVFAVDADEDGKPRVNSTLRSKGSK